MRAILLLYLSMWYGFSTFQNNMLEITFCSINKNSFKQSQLRINHRVFTRNIEWIESVQWMINMTHF